MLLLAVNPLFSLGEVVITRNALGTLSPEAIQDGLSRHASGDWGNVCSSDAELNDHGLEMGDRLFSSYGDGDHKFWIITAPGGSMTTVLLPSDY